MKKWVQSLTSLVMSLALTLGLGGKALAAENESAPAESSAEVEPAETKPAESKPAEAKPAESKPAETKPTESKPAESKPAESKPAEPKPAESKPAEVKPAETKPAEAKPAETKPAEAKPAESKPAESKPAEPKPAEPKPAESKPAESKPAEPKPAEAAPVEQPKPAEAAPVEQPKPAEAAPVEQPKPAEAAPVEQPKPAEAAPVEQPKPAEAAPVEQPKPAEAAPVEQPKPAETAPVEQPKPAEAAPVEQPKPAETALVEQPKPAETAPVDEVKPVEAAPVEQPKPAEDAPVEQPKPAETAPVEEAKPAEAAPFEEAPVEQPKPVEDVSVETPVLFTASAPAKPTAAMPAVAPTLSAVEDPEEELSDTAADAGEADSPSENAEAVMSTASVRSAAPVLAKAAPKSGEANDALDPTGAPADSADAAAPAATAQSNSSCHYTIEDGSHVLVNNSGGSISVGKTDEVTILAAGLNRVDTISGGNVKIGGSGILLVDNFDCAHLDLMSFTDMYGEKGGSVAVFVKDPGSWDEETGNYTYTLINGSVPGILDEEYEINGVKLVVPAGSKLILGSIGATGSGDDITYYTGSNSGAYNADNTESAGHLIIGNGAQFDMDGEFVLTETNSRVLDESNTPALQGTAASGNILPTLGIEGTGQVNIGGQLTGGVIEVNGAAGSSSLNLTGTLSNTLVDNIGSSTLEDLSSGGSVGVFTRSGIDPGSVTKTSGGKTVLSKAQLAAVLEAHSNPERIVIELRRKFKNGTIVTSRFTPALLLSDVTVTDDEAEGEVNLQEVEDPPAGWMDSINSSPYMGHSITSTNISQTGTGILGGNYPLNIDPSSPSTVNVGGQTHTLRAPETKPEPQPPQPTTPTTPTTRTAAAPVNTWRVIVSELEDFYDVSIFYGAREIVNPGQKMTARMKFTLPDGWDADAVFAVFRSANGKLTAFPAKYDAKTGTLTFRTDLTGTFALVSFPFDGKLYSEEFYAALAELEEIRSLPVRR